MDSPTLKTFNYFQFWYEQQNAREEEPGEHPVEHVSELCGTKKSEQEEEQPRKRKRSQDISVKTSEEYRSTKNLAKNYGKAITSFALSDLAMPYLPPILKKQGITLKEFIAYSQAAKETIQSIDSFRACLLPQESDSVKVIGQKKAFQAIGIVFIKYFSVNWIIHGRISNKLSYLKFRFKMLRRLENPEQFTYIQGAKVTTRKRSIKQK